MVARERVELSCPKAPVSKTGAYPNSATLAMDKVMENTMGVEPIKRKRGLKAEFAEAPMLQGENLVHPT